MTPSYAWWASALELVGDYGTLTREQIAALGVHEGDAQPGYYRVPPGRYSDGDESFVEITPTGATWDGVPVDPTDAWGWCCRYPIDEERYRQAERVRFTRGIRLFADPRNGVPTPTGFQYGT